MNSQLKKTKKELSPSEKHLWEQTLQILTLEGIAGETALGIEDLVFHGGTSLRLSWNSPRYSEDLDFMVIEKKLAEIPKEMQKVFNFLERKLKKVDPELKFRFKTSDRRDGSLLNYMLVLEKENVLGSAKVKLEFWSIKNDFLENYQSTWKQPKIHDDINLKIEDMLPVAELKSAYCDKLVALSTRPFLKWRDLFDIWWIRNQNSLNPLKDENFLKFFKHNLSAYSVPEGYTLKTSLERYLNWDRADILKKSETDLKRWLPEKLWQKLYPNSVLEMIEVVERDVKQLLKQLELEAKPKMAVPV